MAWVSLPASGSDSEKAAADLAGGHAGEDARSAARACRACTIERGADGVGVEHAGERHPAVGQLLHEPGVGEGVEAEAAVLLGDAGAEEPEGLHLLDERRRVLVGVLVGAGDRDDLLADPGADGADELVGDLGVGRHRRLPAPAARSRRPPAGRRCARCRSRARRSGRRRCRRPALGPVRNVAGGRRTGTVCRSRAARRTAGARPRR